MSLFDGIQKQVFSTVQNLMGDALTWTPSTGGSAQNCSVLYNSPEAVQQLGDTDKFEYSPYRYSFEFFEDQLTGLKLSVDFGNIETVTIKGITLCVRDVKATKDGKTLIAFCDEYKL